MFEGSQISKNNILSNLASGRSWGNFDICILHDFPRSNFDKNRFGTDFRIFSGFFPGISGVGGMGGALKYAAAARRKL